MHVRLARDAREAAVTLSVPLAPGLVVSVGVAEHRVFEMGDQLSVAPGAGTVALDGERELERPCGEAVTVRLVPGPLTIDVEAVMRGAAQATSGQPRSW